MLFWCSSYGRKDSIIWAWNVPVLVCEFLRALENNFNFTQYAYSWLEPLMIFQIMFRKEEVFSKMQVKYSSFSVMFSTNSMNSLN